MSPSGLTGLLRLWVCPVTPSSPVFQRRSVVGLPEGTPDELDLFLLDLPTKHNRSRQKLGFGHDFWTLICSSRRSGGSLDIPALAEHLGVGLWDRGAGGAAPLGTSGLMGVGFLGWGFLLVFVLFGGNMSRFSAPCERAMAFPCPIVFWGGGGGGSTNAPSPRSWGSHLCTQGSLGAQGREQSVCRRVLMNTRVYICPCL